MVSAGVAAGLASTTGTGVDKDWEATSTGGDSTSTPKSEAKADQSLRAADGAGEAAGAESTGLRLVVDATLAGGGPGTG